jgi:hypothetical protein
MDFVQLETGAQEEAQVPFSIGPYTFARQGAGCYVRIGSQGEGEVLNLKRNVHVTGSLLLGPDLGPGPGFGPDLGPDLGPGFGLGGV